MTTATNEMILASAGTGKTFTLSSRYLRLLVDGVHPRAILATTFTRKAAGEILDRVVQRLADAALDEQVAQQTAIEIQRPETGREVFAELLTSLVANLNNLQVETLDAFFGQIARSFSLDLGLPPDWELVEDDEMARYQDLAIRRSLTRRATLGIIFDLARGEAKRGISGMIRALVDDLYGIYRETADSGTLDAWNTLSEMPTLGDAEIQELERQLVQVEPVGQKRYVEAFRQDLNNLARRDWMTLPEKNLGGALGKGVTTYYGKEIQPEIVRLLSPLVQHATALYINILVRQTRAASQFLGGFHRDFEQLKLDSATLRFEDVNYLANRLLSSYSAGQLAWRMDKQVDHLLLDEFQDTSIEQWQVLRPIARRACAPGPNRSFFCVGDVKQAIYGWRGGVAEIFDDVRTDFSDALEQPTRLNKSWRSSPTIVESVNQIFSGIPRHKNLKEKRFAYQSWCDRFDQHETCRNDLPGYASLENTSGHGDHDRQVARRIRDLACRHPGRSIGVLVRTNENLARLIFELGVAGVPASEEGGNPLTDAASVNLVLSGLRLIDHPDDQIARFHILHSPLAAIFELTDDNWNSDASACRRAAQRFRQQLLDGGYGNLIAGWARILDLHCTPREWFRLNQLTERGYRVSVSDHARTADFVSWVESTRVPDPMTTPVRVMTIHKSKGLEFDIVVLPDLDFGAGRTPTYIVGRDYPTGPVKLVCRYMDSVKQEWLPLDFQTAFDKNMEGRVHEMLSTMYVALTRARHALHMIVPPNINPSMKSAGGLIMAGLGIGYKAGSDAAGQVLWEQGERDWVQQCPASSPEMTDKPQPSVDQQAAASPVIRFAPGQPGRNWTWESPSSREGEDQVRLGRLLQLEDNRDARISGSLIHACLEQVEWLDDWTLDESALRTRLARVAGADSKMIKAAISDFKKIVRRPVLRSLLSRQQYQEDLFESWQTMTVHNERAFAVRIDDRILNGFIDRLVLLERDGKPAAADVIDFKTDQLASGDHKAVQKRTDIYRPQLIAYRDAVASMLGLPASCISARLMFVAIDQQVQID